MGMKQKSVFTVRQIVVSGVLGAIAVLLGVTQLGFIPVPTAAGHATIMHVPAIIGGILEGWVVGGIIGLIFGISSFLNATVPLFKDPLVAILPRLFIGVAAYFVYRGLRRWNDPLAVGVAAFVGSATNTVLVLGMAVVRNYMSLGVAASVAVLNGLPEAVVSVIVTLAVVLAWKRVDRRSSKARI
ncbi:ECF transporter S component [Kyrpidia spormannii]|uniref:ECF transporter S component n=2 Tax=Kyrpidia spormannii TaxID=2055160 RepID=A0A2K8NBX7_9BACL|nr:MULTISPECIES: ECF transporter S component [Kyrpidia]ATY86080.1 ECF transporter S component [Kyrpidia spormannii]MCL6575038.1 ECF transporter S component [Kyrpidia sp.]CAB3395336.1 ECF transporter S component [Kyrpidia spormannii]HHY67736.1 ECF transporter S component [Alicyclobacillus sp.]